MPLGMLFSLEFKAMPMIHSDNHDLDQLEEFMVICVRSCELTEQSAWKTASLTACLCVPRNWISVYEFLDSISSFLRSLLQFCRILQDVGGLHC